MTKITKYMIRIGTEKNAPPSDTGQGWRMSSFVGNMRIQEAQFDHAKAGRTQSADGINRRLQGDFRGKNENGSAPKLGGGWVVKR